MSNSSNFFTSQNSIFPRCVDGRAAQVIVEFVDGRFQVVAKDEQARQENGPQFLGASLVFVRSLEVVANLPRHQSFDLAQQASKAVGLELQIHQDDEHGHFDLSKMSDSEVADFVSNHHTGCGFAKYAWGEQGVEVIKEAKSRKWRVQVLTGSHQEKGAFLNYLTQDTFDSASAMVAQNAAFNTDVLMAREVFEALEELIDQPGFAQRAEEWMIETYQDVVVALKGVENKDQVAIRQ